MISLLFTVTLGDREVVCDMTSGGWLLIQQRVAKNSGSTDFYRNWSDYKSGFGRLQKAHFKIMKRVRRSFIIHTHLFLDH